MNKASKPHVAEYNRFAQSFRDSYRGWGKAPKGSPKQVAHAGNLARLLREYLVVWQANSPRGGVALYIKQHPLATVITAGGGGSYSLGATELSVPLPR